METKEKTIITVNTTVKAPVRKVWEYWSEPRHITQWNFARPEWHCPRANSDLREGGKFSCRMEARDGSMGFDFGGTYDLVKPNECIEYTIDDGRHVKVTFLKQGNTTQVTESFDAESQNPVEMQRAGWQSILDNFKKYVEE